MHLGQPYDHLKWQNFKCRNCRQFQRHILHFFQGNQVS
jgi:hypothetical protein